MSASRTVVVKIGSSSLTTEDGAIDGDAIAKLTAEVARVRADGHHVVVVTSGAIAAGWRTLAEGAPRPSDPATLQAVAAVGQHQLMRVWSDNLASLGLIAGQVLLAPLDFVHRSQYLHARQTLGRLLDLGIVPVVNENDAVADEEIRFGDNDRLAALVAHLVGADLLVLLTDTLGLLTGDPRFTAETSLIEEVVEIDHELELIAGGPGSQAGSGGMASKLAAAKIATWSGVEAVIADASRDGHPHLGHLRDAGSGHPVPAPRAPAARPQALDRLCHRGLGNSGGRRGGPPRPGGAGHVPAPRRRGVGARRVRPRRRRRDHRP